MFHWPFILLGLANIHPSAALSVMALKITVSDCLKVFRKLSRYHPGSLILHYSFLYFISIANGIDILLISATEFDIAILSKETY